MNQLELEIIALMAIVSATYWFVRWVNSIDATGAHETRNNGTL